MARPYGVSSLWRLYPDQSRIWNRDAYLDNVFLYNVHWVRPAIILYIHFTYLLSPLRSLWSIWLLESLSIPLCVGLSFFCLIPSLPNIFKFFQSCFFPTAEWSLLSTSPLYLWLYYNMYANQISSYITRINMFVFFSFLRYIYYFCISRKSNIGCVL